MGGPSLGEIGETAIWWIEEGPGGCGSGEAVGDSEGRRFAPACREAIAGGGDPESGGEGGGEAGVE